MREGLLKNVPLVAERVISDFRTGSSLPVLVETASGMKSVVKWKCSGEGPIANAVDWICLHLARKAGITVPTPRLITITPALVDDRQDPDINDLINRSLGINLGVDFIPNAIPFVPNRTGSIDPALRNLIYLFDLLFLNIDRTDHNPNMVISGEILYCIDFAASMAIKVLMNGQSYSEGNLLSLIRRHPFYATKERTLIIVPDVDHEFIADVVHSIPDEWLVESKASKEEMTAGIVSLLADIPTVLGNRLALLERIQPESAEAMKERTMKNRTAFEQKVIEIRRKNG